MEVSVCSSIGESIEPESIPRIERSCSWDEIFDETYQLHYYVHCTTGQCQWDVPQSFTGHQLNDNNVLKVPENEQHNLCNASECGERSDSVQDGNMIDQAYLEEPRETKMNYKDVWKDFFNKDDVKEDAEEQVETEYVTYLANDDQRIQEYDNYLYDDNNYFEGNDLQNDGENEEHEEFAPYDEESAPLTVKNRSKDVPAGGGTTQDYVHMARMYKLTRPYSDPNYYGLCLLCHTNFADMVYFPCEHRCVCSACIEKESICTDVQFEKTPGGYCNCSLCAGIIKLILPSEGGAEVDKYWQWVYEEPVQLPPRFMRDFRHSAAVIQTVRVRNGNNADSFENASKSCSLS